MARPNPSRRLARPARAPLKNATTKTNAEELHFGRTAERLGISVSYVSQRISSIERRLAAKLFERTSRRVHLTVVGPIFAQDIAPIVAQLNSTLAAATGMAAGMSGVLRVGHVMTVDGSVAVRRLVDEFRARVPGTSVRRLRVDIIDYVDALHQGDLDVWLTWWPSPAPGGDPAEGLRCGPPIARERPALLIGRNHPLAAIIDRHGRPDRAPDHRAARVRPAAVPTALEPDHRTEWSTDRPSRVPGVAGPFPRARPRPRSRSARVVHDHLVLETVSLRHDPVTVPIENGADFVLLPWWSAEHENPCDQSFCQPRQRVGGRGRLRPSIGRGRQEQRQGCAGRGGRCCAPQGFRGPANPARCATARSGRRTGCPARRLR